MDTSKPNVVQATVTLDVRGWPELRRELAQIIRDVAASEADARVAARLHEVAALVAQTAAEREASERVKTVVPHTPRAERELTRDDIAIAIAKALPRGGKAS
jgi:hypothetical protein